jgi:hypothetical protein
MTRSNGGVGSKLVWNVVVHFNDLDWIQVEMVAELRQFGADIETERRDREVQQRRVYLEARKKLLDMEAELEKAQIDEDAGSQ